MPESVLLHCPIRGSLQVPQRAKDGLTFTEEKRRIDAIRFLLQRDYPAENFGIETTLLRFGHKGRNSFRVDFSVYEHPWAEVRKRDREHRLDDVAIVAEIKRGHATSREAKATQVRPALNLLPDLKSLGVYWDDVGQRFFYRELAGTKTEVLEAPISKIPRWGEDLGATHLTFGDLDQSKDLVQVFDQLEFALHPYVADKSKRYAVLLQLLIAKIWDETRHSANPLDVLDIQDYSALAVMDPEVVGRMDKCLGSALGHYQRYLPERIDKTFGIPSEALRRATQIIAPVNVMESKQKVIQSFYMKFAQNLYKWDLAQYFTPHEVVDFIVDVTNPQYGEHVKDPACGSADFLVSALVAGRAGGPKFDEFVNGNDNSGQAVQVSILNMVLHGDGKSNISQVDSLEACPAEDGQYGIVLCNPPFGKRITERRWEILRKFDMGHKWTTEADGRIVVTQDVHKTQQVGILFAELCVRLLKPGGRMAIIFPNGYLGNVSDQYHALREWLLRHTRLVGIVSFPRFTFKKSGADVSASVVFLEKRDKSLAAARDSEDYPFFVGMIESVGWRAGDKKAVPTYLRDPETGVLILDDSNEPMLDSDFEMILEEFLRSPASNSFPWLLKGRELPKGPQGWSVSMRSVVDNSPALILDPKRHCSKVVGLRKSIEGAKHFRVGDVLEPVANERFKPELSKIYSYVEIGDIRAGDHGFQEMRGWELPGRAKLTAKPGDFFIAHPWGCAGKWFASTKEDPENMVVTNGCSRFRRTKGSDSLLIDLVAGLCSEAFAVQVRAYTTGSDGLAEISDDDLRDVVLPRVTSSQDRKRLASLVDDLLSGSVNFAHSVQNVLTAAPDWPTPAKRKSHCILV